MLCLDGFEHLLVFYESLNSTLLYCWFIARLFGLFVGYFYKILTFLMTLSE